jgi:hypothetical protein
LIPASLCLTANASGDNRSIDNDAMVAKIKALLSASNLRPQEQGTDTESNLPGRTTCWPA